MKSFAIFAYFSTFAVLLSCSPNTNVTQSLPTANGGASTNVGGASTDTNNSNATIGGSSVGSSNANSGGASTGSSTTSTGGTSASASTATSAGGTGNTSTGGASVSNGGSTNAGGSTTKAAGGANNAGGSTASGGTQSSGGVVAAGGKSSTANAGGAAGNTASSGAAGASVVYELPPPDQCHDQDYIPYDYNAKTGCLNGDASTDCGGKCQVINACSETTASKPNADITFMCPRNLLFSAAMEQAAADDGNTGFHYAVVGHDIDPQGIDSGTQSACCQCYQLVYAYPSPANDRQGQLNPDNPNPPASAVTVPAPLIVQAFNTAATPTTFDVYMGAGGLGAHNACAPVAGSTSASGKYMYTAYPDEGQPSQGGLKPASLFPECRTKDKNWLTTASFTDPACQSKIKTACNEITSNIPGLTEQSRSSCIRANSIETFYHLNWSVYAMKVECPEQLTRVTGCKLQPQGLPQVKRNVTTAAQAALDKDFWAKTGTSSNLYETTTMEDCCRPSCSAIGWISGKGLKPDPQYRAFYTCDGNGVPYTQK